MGKEYNIEVLRKDVGVTVIIELLINTGKCLFIFVGCCMYVFLVKYIDVPTMSPSK
jgi:hypothetical protein